MTKTAKRRPSTNGHTGDHFVSLPLDAIKPSPGNPRRTYDANKLNELAESIKAKGVLQPILVRRAPLIGDHNENLAFLPGMPSGAADLMAII
jgi:hypothetical protein